MKHAPWFLIVGLFVVGCAAPESSQIKTELVVRSGRTPLGEPCNETRDCVEGLVCGSGAVCVELVDAVCPGDRYIGVVSPFVGGDPCTDIGPWRGESLFSQGTPWLSEHPSAAPGKLRNYCRYQWDGGGPEPSAFETAMLLTEDRFLAISSDCEVVTPEAEDALSDELVGDLSQMFAARAGRPVLNQGGERVTVAVVDTMPPSGPKRPRSRHGETMARIISDLACPQSASGCQVSVQRVLGLPRFAGGLDVRRGGVLGSHGDLAAGIHEAVRRWQLNDPGSRLVLNLSVGWEPELFGSGVVPMLGSVDAVHAALQYASCQGAVIFASTGNDGGLCTSGPMLPAAWELENAPQAVRCAELGSGLAEPALPGDYRPLVHAVGGVGLAWGPMPASRDGARPRLNAAATHAVTGMPSTPVLTGTSVASAVASSAAALVWSYNSQLSAADVSAALYDGGSPFDTNMRADFGAPGVRHLPRRIDACRAVQVACKQPASCPPVPACPVPNNVSLDDLFDTVNSVIVSDEIEPTWPAEDAQPLMCPQACGADPAATVFADGVLADCGRTYVDPTLRLVAPQPGSIGCPTCTVDADLVIASTHSDYDGSTIDDVSIEVVDDQGNKTVFAFGEESLDSSQVTTLSLDPSRMPETVRSASITIHFDGFNPTTDPLILD